MASAHLLAAHWQVTMLNQGLSAHDIMRVCQEHDLNDDHTIDYSECALAFCQCVADLTFPCP
eukprot:5626717-Prymnesium_polylepis.2